MTESNNTKRIAKNTLLLYFRMLFMMLVVIGHIDHLWSGNLDLDLSLEDNNHILELALNIDS